MQCPLGYFISTYLYLYLFEISYWHRGYQLLIGNCPSLILLIFRTRLALSPPPIYADYTWEFDSDSNETHICLPSWSIFGVNKSVSPIPENFPTWSYINHGSSSLSIGTSKSLRLNYSTQICSFRKHLIKKSEKAFLPTNPNLDLIFLIQKGHKNYA